MTIFGKSIHGAIALGLAASAVSFAADPMPYDSIGNPLNKLLPSDPTIQRKGDSLNMTLNRVRVNQAGYRQVDVAAGYAKFYCVGCAGTSFSVVNGAGAAVGSGTLTPKGVTVSGQITEYASNSAERTHNGDGDWKKGYPMVGKTTSGALSQGILPLTLPVGQYTIRVGADSSVPFVVSDNVYGMARDAAIKFFGVARSGDYESWFHPASHMWDGWLHDSAAKNADGTYKYKGALKGGWYDCGNHLKEARTNSYPLAALGMLAATMPERDADRYALNQGVTLKTDGIPDVLREAWVGAQFVVNSWRLANGKAADMVLSIGKLSNDFRWWGRPENHDAVLTQGLGGRKERFLVKDWGSASMADFAAGMAFLARQYRPYDAAFADSALTIAKAMYETAKLANKKEGSLDYSPDIVAFDDLGLAAVALLWATGDARYLQEIAYAKGLPDGVGGVCGASAYAPGSELRQFEGGYFGCGTNGIRKTGGPTSYVTVNSFAVYAFAKLILANADTARRYGISAGMRDTMLVRSIVQFPASNWSGSGALIEIPLGANAWEVQRLNYDSIWYSMDVGPGVQGFWNKYQFGNLADLYMFYDMTALAEGRTLPGFPGSTDWKRKDILQVILGGLNYMFGTNPLELSYLYGVGRKNAMHPHHRAANPEGRNVPGAYYNYTVPVGGLFGGPDQMPPKNDQALVEKFGGPLGQSEANCPDAQAAVMIPLMGLSREIPVVAPVPTVKVLYTTDTSADIQIDLDKWGTLKIGYGLHSSVVAQTTLVRSSDTGNTFRIHIRGLTPATQYFFHVIATDLGGLASTTSKWPNGQSDSIPYSYTTKAQPQVPPRYANIKACNITSDSAEIMWYTPNGEYLSSVKFADSANWKAGKFSVVDTDAVGDVPVKFHRVKLKGLKAKTTYYFQVGVPGSYDAEIGCFRTPGEDVKFDIRTTHYTWDGKPAMGIAVINQDVKSYDSLAIRLYVNGTRDNILDLAARVDIAFAYMSAGYTDTGLFAYTKDVQRSRPKLIDPACPAATQSCAWYFDLPMYGAVMQSQARWRIDVIFDRHNLIRDSTEILNMAPTHDPFAPGTQDWSIRAHVAGSDNGLSPVDYPGVPLGTKNAIDSMAQYIPVNPYIAVFRRNEFVYGFSPYAAEQATKRVVYAMNVAFEKPFDITNGNTIQIGSGESTRLKGTLDPYDVMMPAVKGHINQVWVNGVALTEAERKAALSRQANGTWKVDLPLRLVTGTNKVDVTFFAGSDSTESVPTGTCAESRGCAFYNASWYVNYVSNFTPSLLSVVDAAGNAVGLVTPDSSVVRIRVNDGNANLSKTAADGVTVAFVDAKSGQTQLVISLAETGPNTGVFESELRSVVSTAPVGAQIRNILGDTVLIRYVDASDETDSSSARIWSKASWPSLVSGAVHKDCGSAYASARFDRKLGTSILTGPELIQNASFETPKATTIDQYYVYTGKYGAWQLSNIDLVSASLTPLSAGEGDQSLDLNARSAGAAWQILTTTPGTKVRLSMLYSMNNAVGGTDPTGPRLARISWNRTVVDTLRLLGSEPRVWKAISYELTATGRDSIHIQGLNSGDGGIMLDNLSLQVVTVGAGASSAIRGGRVAVVDGAGDTIYAKSLSSSEIAIEPDGSSVRIELPASATIGVSGGLLSLQVYDGTGKTVTTSALLVDSVGPWIDSTKIVENLSGNPFDTLYVWSSETPKFGAGTFPALVSRNGASVPTAGLAVQSASSDPATGRWTFVLAAGVVKAGDSLRWSPTLVSDAKGNAALDCPSLARVVRSVSRPAPFTRAWIHDVDGDGRADQVVLLFQKQLVASDLPDSIRMAFGNANTLRSAAVDLSMATGSVLTLPLLDPFPVTDTRGSAADGAGKLDLWKSGEASGPYPLIDSVGPNLLSAKLRFGSQGVATDTLELEFSESVRRTLGSGWLTLQPSTELGTAGAPDSLLPKLWKLPVDTSRVAPGDLVRPFAAGGWVDSSAGNPVGANHAWVPVQGGERGPVGGWFQDTNGDGAVDRATVRFSRTPRTRSAMRLMWPSATGFDVAEVDSGAWTLEDDGLTVTIPVGPFAIAKTSSSTTDLGRWISGGLTSSFPMADKVAPVLVSASLRYASKDGDPDTLKLRWSEPLSWTTGPIVFRDNAANGVLPENVSYLAPLPDADGLGVALLVDSTTTTLRRGDSAKLAAGVPDALGNIVGDITVRVPVTFGQRPPRLDFKLHPFVDYDKTWVPAAAAPFQTWVRQRGEAWQLPDGTAPLDVDDEHFLGLELTLNQFLDGAAYIFDYTGVFVAKADFGDIRKMVDEGRFQADGSGTYQIRLAWDGRTPQGNLVASGVYYMRLVLKFQLEGATKPFLVNRVYSLGFKRAID